MVYTWNRTVCNLLRLTFVAKHNFSDIYPGCSLSQESIPFIAEEESKIWRHHSMFEHLQTERHMGHSWLKTTMTAVAMNICAQVFT